MNHSFKSLGRELGLDISVVNGQLNIVPLTSRFRHQAEMSLPSWSMVDACRADDFAFLNPAVAAGKLTTEQVRHAVRRYHLGQTRSGQPIFWMIDHRQQPLDAHILPDTWLSTLLKTREPLIRSWCVTHCLFGLHLLNNNSSDSCHSWSSKPIGVLESESSAVILSELFPESLWFAYATTSHLTPALFAPLQGHRVILYPRTDPSLSTYLFFENFAALVRQHYPTIDISVDTTLEDNATVDQKERCIDLVDFLFDSS